MCFDNSFARLSENGIRIREIRRWTTEQPVCNIDNLSAQIVWIQETLAGTIFLLLAFGVSAIILVSELIYGKHDLNIHFQYFCKINFAGEIILASVCPGL